MAAARGCVCSFVGCSKAFSKPSRLVCHMRSHTGEKPCVCQYAGCSRSYSRAAHLKRHVDTAHKSIDDEQCLSVEVISCTEAGCSESFQSNQSLKKHIANYHQRQYKCSHEGCGRLFRKHQQVKIHEYEHTLVKPFKCQHEGCGKRFLLPSKLKQHITTTHTGYKCTEPGCETVFPKWSLLVKHKAKSHQTVFKCSECGRAFSQQNRANRHMVAHQSARRMYMCPETDCPRAYYEMRNLNAHIGSYHKGQRFRCTEDGCSGSFTAKQKLNEHLKSHDPNKSLPKKKKRKSGPRKSMASRLTGIRDKSATTYMLANPSDAVVPSNSYIKSTLKTLDDSEFVNNAPADGSSLEVSQIGDVLCVPWEQSKDDGEKLMGSDFSSTKRWKEIG